MPIQLQNPVTRNGLYYAFKGQPFEKSPDILLTEGDIHDMRDLINRELGVYQPTLVSQSAPAKVTISDDVLSALIGPLDLSLDEALRAYLVASGVVIK